MSTRIDGAGATAALWSALSGGGEGLVGPAVAAAIAAGADIEARDASSATPLLVATRAGLTEAARILLEAGADPNAQDADLDSAFLEAGALGRTEIAVLAAAHGADFGVVNRYGGTALIPACERGFVETVRALLGVGVPVDHVNRLGWTGLHEAIILGTGGADHTEVVRLLLGAGADPNLPDGEGTTPFELADSRGYTEMAGLIASAPGFRARAPRERS